MSFWAQVLVAISEWILSQFRDYILIYFKKKEVVDLSDKDAKQLADAKTLQEKEDAAKTIVDNTFH